MTHQHWDEKQSKGWHEHTNTIRPNSLIDTLEKYADIIDWIQNSIDQPFRHARWRINQNLCIQTRFRYERDFIIYSLRWGQ